jgi:hypothetical protein
MAVIGALRLAMERWAEHGDTAQLAELLRRALAGPQAEKIGLL